MSNVVWPRIIACDFDGTIIEEGLYPEVGQPIMETVDSMDDKGRSSSYERGSILLSSWNRIRRDQPKPS